MIIYESAGMRLGIWDRCKTIWIISGGPCCQQQLSVPNTKLSKLGNGKTYSCSICKCSRVNLHLFEDALLRLRHL